MRFKSSLIAASALLMLATPGMAHRNWLLPSATIFSAGDDWVTIDAAESSDLFFADHRPLQLNNVKVWAPDGTESKIENGSSGRVRSTFDVHLDKPGTWRIAMVQSGANGSFKVNGEEWRLGGRRPAPIAPAGGGAAPAPAPKFVSSIDEIPANATDVKITEMSGRNEVFATNGEPTDTVFQTTGKGLEMVPVTHPAELVKGEPARLKFLVDGKPAQGLKLTVMPGLKRYRDGDGSFEIMTGADGIATIDFPEAGMFWMTTSLTDDKPANPKATARRMSWTATMEVMAP
ncbi:MAG: DUF4198 domain-containing protein [Sphingobium sp.]|nr:DUF4198 domain-containing protein [Sphingobium sp.]